MPIAAAQSVEATTTTEPIEVDGVLDEAAWQAATPITDFKRYRPTQGGPPPGVTEMYVLQDDTHLYIGARISALPHTPSARISRREDINDDDQIGVYLDPFLAKSSSGYMFYVNPRGIQQDVWLSASWDFNFSWNTVWYAEGALTDDGYVIEIAYPWRSLRYPRDEGEQTWGLMLTQKVPHDGTKYAWPQLTNGHPRWFAQVGELTVDPAPAGSGVELMPVLAVGQTRTDEGWSGFDPWTDALKPGLDARLGITPDTGLALTVNPDFSQVEGDVAQLALNTRYALYYQEQRPFFLDGIDAFQDRQDTVYTRSLVEPLYGVKGSGRVGDTSIGVLHGLDMSPAGSVNIDGALGFDDPGDRWATNSFVRVRQDVFDGGYVGVSAADKRLSDRGAANDVLGADVVVPLGDSWTSSAQLAGAYTQDGDDWLGGHRAGARVRKAEGVGWSGELAVLDVGPGYRQETGFLTNSGVTDYGAFVGHQFDNGGLLDTLTPGVFAELEDEREGNWRSELGAYHEVQAGPQWWNVYGAFVDESYEGVTFSGHEAGVEQWGPWTRWFSTQNEVSYSRELDYDTLTPGTSWEIDLWTTWRPWVPTRIDLAYSHHLFTPDGAATELAQSVYAKVNHQLSRSFGVRLTAQRTWGTGFDAPAWQTSQLLTWLQTPGTEAYLGAAQTLDDGIDELTLFLKVSKLFRL